MGYRARADAANPAYLLLLREVRGLERVRLVVEPRLLRIVRRLLVVLLYLLVVRRLLGVGLLGVHGLGERLVGVPAGSHGGVVCLCNSVRRVRVLLMAVACCLLGVRLLYLPVSPNELSASPSELSASPSELSASPSELVASPSELSASPSELVASPSEAAVPARSRC
jgi:hypothetical protein